MHGFGLASQFYFGKPLAELQLHEVALLVRDRARASLATIPVGIEERARARRDLVLKLMTQYKVVDERAAKAGGEATARHRQHRRAGGRLLPGVPRSGPAHAASRLSRRRSDRSGTQDLLDAQPADRRAASERSADAGAGATRQGAQARRTQPLEGVVVVDGAAEWRSASRWSAAGRRASMASIAHWMRKRSDRLAGEAGHLSRGDRDWALPRGVDRRRRPGRSEAGEWQGVDAAEHFEEFYGPGAAGARARAVAESRDACISDLEVGLPKVTNEFVALGLEQSRRNCRRCCSARSMFRRSKSRSCTTRSRMAVSSTPLRAVRAVRRR